MRSRQAAHCRAVDQPILMSAAFDASVGRFALRSGNLQEFYTLDTQV